MSNSNITMCRVTAVFTLSLMCCIPLSCSDSRQPYLVVAEKFARTLHDFTENPTPRNQSRVKTLSSDYTAQLVADKIWVERLLVHGKFEYQYVRDSLSADKMRAYVWYVNGSQAMPRKEFVLTLRQSLSGWIVDMPIM